VNEQMNEGMNERRTNDFHQQFVQVVKVCLTTWYTFNFGFAQMPRWL